MDKGVFTYLGQLGAVAKRHRAALVMTFVWPALVDATQAYNEARLGLLASKNAHDLVWALTEPYLVYLLISAVGTFFYVSWRVWRELETSIESKQQLLDHSAADIAENEKRLRESYRRREARLQARHDEETQRLRREHETELRVSSIAFEGQARLMAEILVLKKEPIQIVEAQAAAGSASYDDDEGTRTSEE